MSVLAERASAVMGRVAATAAALLAAAAMIGCDSASSPSPVASRLNLRAGPHLISFLAFGISQDPQFPPCTPAGVPAAGTSVATRVTLAQSGGEWIARSASASAGTLEVRLRDSGESTLRGDGVTGTVRGSGIDLGQELRLPADVRITLGSQTGAAALAGAVERTASLATGRISGAITFSDSQNATASCTAVQWLMQPVAGVLTALALNPPQPAW